MVQEDPEIKAMGTIARALVDLDSEAQARVLDWAARRFNVSLPSGGGASGRGLGDGRTGGGGPDLNPPRDAEFQDFVDLFDGAGPRTDAERALVGGYWFQIVGGNTDFQSQE